jgi:hypothetical protein
MEQLERLGVVFQHYLAGKTYICRCVPHDLTELRSLPFLHFVNAYHPDYVVVHDLKADGLTLIKSEDLAIQKPSF